MFSIASISKGQDEDIVAEIKGLSSPPLKRSLKFTVLEPSVLPGWLVSATRQARLVRFGLFPGFAFIASSLSCSETSGVPACPCNGEDASVPCPWNRCAPPFIDTLILAPTSQGNLSSSREAMCMPVDAKNSELCRPSWALQRRDHAEVRACSLSSRHSAHRSKSQVEQETQYVFFGSSLLQQWHALSLFVKDFANR